MTTTQTLTVGTTVRIGKGKVDYVVTHATYDGSDPLLAGRVRIEKAATGGAAGWADPSKLVVVTK